MADGELQITGPEAAVIRSLDARLRQLEEAYTHHSAHGESRAAPLVVALNLRGVLGRAFVEVWVKSSAPADFIVESSADGKRWWPGETLTVEPPDFRAHAGYLNGMPVIRVRTAAHNDNEIEIVAAR